MLLNKPVRLQQILQLNDILKSELKNDVMNQYNLMLTESESIKYDHRTSELFNERNRYQNILANESSRYRSDNLLYINANWVEDKYILTQGPMLGYIHEFWSMVFDTKCKIIVCLANENDQIGFDSYFDDQFIIEYGSYSIQVAKKAVLNSYNITIRDIVIKKRHEPELFATTMDILSEVEVTIKHIQYTAWPDDGVPVETKDVLTVLSFVDKYSDTDSPIIIHCSAGVGRTGTFVVIKDIVDRIIDFLIGADDNNILDINIGSIVTQFRRYRRGLVQTQCQFEFCYQAIIKFIELLQSHIANSNLEIH